jgi:ADP-ribose pyrophosphatase
MRNFCLAIFFGTLISYQSTLSIGASEITRQQYIELISLYPNLIQPLGSASKGEIEIVLDEDRMASIEKKCKREVGVVARDKYWLWINDACIFPSGQEGIYGRILHINALTTVTGVAVMPVMPDGSIVLNCNFRHATRSWEIELPRGGVNAGEDIEAAARRETVEETGMVIDTLSLLGEIPPDSGLTSTVVPIFMAKVIKKQDTQQEETEAIEEILSLSLIEIKQGFVKGYLNREIRGVEKRILFRDPFLAYAVLLYELKK